MILRTWLDELDYELVRGSLDVEVTEVVYDSRKAVPGAVFVCMAGTRVDSHCYVPDVLRAGVRVLVTVICTAGLWALGNPYFLLLGIVIGLMDALPFIGTGIILIPIAVSWIFRKNVKMALGYAGLFLLTYIVREILEPRLLGRKLGIYPFVLVITVYAGIYLYGIAGVILGPVTLLTVKEIWNEVSNPDYE